MKPVHHESYMPPIRRYGVDHEMTVQTLDLTKVDFSTKTDKELFEMVQNPKGWKYSTIPAKVFSKYEADRLVNAITYFAGGAEVRRVGNNAIVESKGYYFFIGA